MGDLRLSRSAIVSIKLLTTDPVLGPPGVSSFFSGCETPLLL